MAHRGNRVGTTPEQINTHISPIAQPATSEIHHVDQAQYEARLFISHGWTTAFSTQITRNDFPTLRRSKAGEEERQAPVSNIKLDASLFGKLYIANQVRDGDPAVWFFLHTRTNLSRLFYHNLGKRSLVQSQIYCTVLMFPTKPRILHLWTQIFCYRPVLTHMLLACRARNFACVPV